LDTAININPGEGMSFDEARLRTIVETLATGEGRMIGTPGHAEARSFLVEQLEGIAGVEPDGGKDFALPYGDPANDLANVIGRIPGHNLGLDPLLIAAHYDTCGPYPGADDNAAAIAIALELVPRLVEAQLGRSVLIALFDGEEPPLFMGREMGSIHWYHHQRQGEVHCALVMDLVGHGFPIPGNEDLVAVLGMESDAQLAQVLAGLEEPPGARLIPTLNRYIGDLSDHHVFRISERPYLFFSCGTWEHYHMPSDTPEKLDYPKMAAFGKLLATLVPRLCDQPLDGPFEGYDSTPVELELLNRQLGPFLRALDIELDGRAAITELIEHLTGNFEL
jgi:hypothetical protein